MLYLVPIWLIVVCEANLDSEVNHDSDVNCDSELEFSVLPRDLVNPFLMDFCWVSLVLM